MYKAFKIESSLFIVDTDNYFVTEINNNILISIEHFHQLDIILLLDIFENYPDYAPYENLLHIATSQSVEICRERMNDPTFFMYLSNMISRMRKKLKNVHLEVVSVFRLGYQLKHVERMQKMQLIRGDEMSIRNARFKVFELERLIDDDKIIVYDQSSFIVTLMSKTAPEIFEQQTFSVKEGWALLVLLESYPYVCPYAKILWTFAEKKNDVCYYEEEVEYAYNHKMLDSLLKPQRNSISRMRMKVRHFDIEIASTSDVGYTLTKTLARLSGSLR